VREPEEVDCHHAWECFGGEGPWGKGAYDDPLSSACGGRPWGHCHCMTQEERKELEMARKCDHCGEAVADGKMNEHVCGPIHYVHDSKHARKIPLTQEVPGAKWDDNKCDWSFLPSKPIEEVLKIYAGGAKKYGRGNYKKGIHYSRVFSAAMRHLWAWWRCEDKDEESGLSHLAHACWNVITLLEYTMSNKYLPFDDRRDLPVVSIPSVFGQPLDPSEMMYTITSSTPVEEGVTYWMKDGKLERVEVKQSK